LITKCLSLSVFMFVLAGNLLHAAPGARLHSISAELEQRNAPVSWKVGEADVLTIDAAGKTNWFIAPTDGRRWDSAPMLLFNPAENFVLSARITLQFRARWDAGALTLYVDEKNWAKFAFEAPEEGQPAVVSVVTRGESDDCTSMPVREGSIYLKIEKIGLAFNFYASSDGRAWKMIRSFRLNSTAGLRAGFSAQSPIGDGATVVFSEIQYSATQK
jgi:uncharacterized protein